MLKSGKMKTLAGILLALPATALAADVQQQTTRSTTTVTTDPPISVNAQAQPGVTGVTSLPAKGTLSAALVEPERNSAKKAATIEVKLSDIAMVDPALAGEKPKIGEGHLHYQLDGGPMIATTTTKLSFHGLTPGSHQITVLLAGNDHAPLGPRQTLTVNVP